jgi:hypothetical protein
MLLDLAIDQRDPIGEPARLFAIVSNDNRREV